MTADAELLAPLLVTTVFATALTARGFRQPDRLLNSLTLVGATVLFFFVARPAYIWSMRETSIGAAVDTVALTDGLQSSLVRAAWTCAVFSGAIFAGLSLTPTRSARVDRRRYVPAVGVATWLVIGLVLVNLASLVLVVRSAGSLSAYVSGLAVRSQTLRGQSYFGLMYLPLMMASALLWIALRQARREGAGGDVSRAPRFVLIAGIAIGLLGATASGGRAAVLLGCVLPLALVRSAVIGPFKLRGAVFLAITATVAFVAIADVLRTSQFEKAGGADSRGGMVTAITDLPVTLLGGLEARPFDSVLYLRSPDAERVPALNGSTYQTAWTYFVPRKLWPDKPFAGGNAWFTSTFNPRFYSSDRVETSISAVGEAWANFRWTGVIGVGLLFGAALGLWERLRRERAASGTVIVLYAFVAPVAISFLRGDAYHNIPFVVTIGVIYLTFSRLSHRRSAIAGPAGGENEKKSEFDSFSRTGVVIGKW